jgi:atypical dual specificity phosphatase
VDRVNLLPSDRAHWLAVAFKGPSAIVIHLSTPPHLAAVRAAGRVDHPTLSPLSAERVSLAAARSFVPAGVADIAAGFAAVLTVPGAAAADESVRLLSQGGRAAPRRPPSLAKFPRTRHLLALGGASRDDLVMSAADAAGVLALAKSGTVTVEEKLDGANLGFSLDVATGALLVQNRSHYVTSASHAQFRSLGAYVRRHDAALRRILASGSVLYGEWLYARHSVRYSRLPSAFIAFDLMDRRSGRFLSRSAFREVLLGTGIAVVPEVAVDVSVDGLVSAVGYVESLYAAGEVAEGVVVRVDEDGWLRERVKVVRAGFIPGNEHWGRRGLERNGLTAAGASELYN